jgi:hypothetical protein
MEGMGEDYGYRGAGDYIKLQGGRGLNGTGQLELIDKVGVLSIG